MKSYLKNLAIQNYVGVFLLVVFILFFANFASAQDAPKYVSLVSLPGFNDGETEGSLPGLINSIYLLSIGLGALLGVIKIAIAGVKYSMSDIVTDKASAKKDIMGVLLGLLILLMPYIVLNEIYPNLTNLNFLERITPLDPYVGLPNAGREKEVVYNQSCGVMAEPLCLKQCQDHIDKNKLKLGEHDISVTPLPGVVGGYQCSVSYIGPSGGSGSYLEKKSTVFRCTTEAAGYAPCKPWCEEKLEKDEPQLVRITDTILTNDPGGNGKICDVFYVIDTSVGGGGW